MCPVLHMIDAWCVHTLTLSLCCMGANCTLGHASAVGFVRTIVQVLQLADTMASQLLSSGYEYLVLDGGWSATTTILPNGTKYGHPVLDEYGRPLPDPNRQGVNPPVVHNVRMRAPVVKLLCLHFSTGFAKECTSTFAPYHC